MISRSMDFVRACVRACVRRGNFFGTVPMITQEEFDQCARTAARAETVVARVDLVLFEELAAADRTLARTLCRHMLGIISPLVQQVSRT